MGRWVTSKGRRIYIPDEGEKVPEKYKKNVNRGFSNLHGPDPADPEGKKKMSEYNKEKTSDYLKKVGKKDSMELLKDISNNPEAKAELEKAFKEPGFKKEMADATVAFIHSKHKLGQKKNDGVKDTINKNEVKDAGSQKVDKYKNAPKGSKEYAVDMMKSYHKDGYDPNLMKKDGKYQVAVDTKETEYAEKRGWKYSNDELTDEDRAHIRSARKERLKEQINKDADTKEKQIAANKAQVDKLNGKKEEFVVGNNPPTTKEQAYMNYKAIKISKNMPKEKQEELKRLKAKYRKEWKGR